MGIGQGVDGGKCQDPQICFRQGSWWRPRARERQGYRVPGWSEGYTPAHHVLQQAACIAYCLAQDPPMRKWAFNPDWCYCATESASSEANSQITYSGQTDECTPLEQLRHQTCFVVPPVGLRNKCVILTFTLTFD